jgi:tellurium resistance protein TerZ
MHSGASQHDRILSNGDIVVGVQWSPSDDAQRARTAPVDLDAICDLRDANGTLVEIVGPGRLRSRNGSVMHTGDSRDGASRWDDERIFVFLDALPAAVDSVVFTIASSSGYAFCDVPGASCHISDLGTEDRLFEIELAALGKVTAHEVARIVRCGRGWRLTVGAGGRPLIA